MSLVVDASVALKWFVPETGHEAAIALLRNDGDLLAPDWLLIEVANALWKQWRRNAIDPQQIDDMLGMLTRILVLSDARPLVGRASSIARSLDHPVYDCLYLALAETNRVPLATDNRTLLKKAAAANFPVQPLQGSVG
ncbi:type II toxin-antitoxin system VapC family toxin [Candidatus Thiosymbion oneisti]|uniref:type II toxin-antitoxin system VapC family toxin n=1 Tax=Candidatus Thiosymbion oneisti TaxID=589554 RepID=UPI000A4CE55C|nr:type II toxin-antitoxin system VapC family toxin [Candidatus Thiosymbion oneisti]